VPFRVAHVYNKNGYARVITPFRCLWVSITMTKVNEFAFLCCRRAFNVRFPQGGSLSASVGVIRAAVGHLRDRSCECPLSLKLPTLSFLRIWEPAFFSKVPLISVSMSRSRRCTATSNPRESRSDRAQHRVSEGRTRFCVTFFPSAIRYGPPYAVSFGSLAWKSADIDYGN